MLTKYTLHAGSTTYELQDDDLKNWDQIECSYKRSSYDGVVRSFTSKFEFVNRAAELLWGIYLLDRFNASAVLEVLTMNDNWEFDKRFECPLDFSTIEKENGVVSINAVDSSLAALIKANKSTKYELEVGTDIPTSDSVKITRLPMKESLTYGFTQGSSYDDCEDIRVTCIQGELPWVGNKGSEIAINLAVDWKDDQSHDEGSYILRAVKDVRVAFSYKFSYRSNHTTEAVTFILTVKRNGITMPSYGDDAVGCECGSAQNNRGHNFGTFSDPSQLPDISSAVWSDSSQVTDWRYGGYAIINGIVWECSYRGGNFIWEDTQKTVDDYFLQEVEGDAVLDLKAGDIVYMRQTMSASVAAVSVRFKTSEFVFEWMATGEDAYVDVLTPKRVAKSVLQKIVGTAYNVHVDISDYDPRLANTYIMAAESIRLIPSAKLYTSFNEFCDWMSAVFGYVYYIGETAPTKYPKKQDFGRINNTPYEPSGFYSGTVDTDKILYNSYRKCFFYSDDGWYYATWIGSEKYNNPETGHPWTDTVFFERGGETVNAWVFPEYNGEASLDPIEYDGDDEVVGSDDQTVYFVHRSELLRPSAPIKQFEHVRDVKYSVDSASIYASVTAGYDKKDYESVNGRDEFNFNNTYTTGCTVSDKTLSLLSKYRADCYGIEFAIQKRDEDTTDTTSDKDVFFTLCTKEGGQLIIDRSCEILNGISDALFNGAFSPMACIMANAGYIGLQSNEMQLTFASSTGNSDIEVSGVAMSADLTIDTPLATVGTVEFTTDEVEMTGDENDLIEVTGEDGTLYRGFLKEVDIKYAKAEAAKYKLIVKDIEP
ncbi:MAG: hypothetical protein NC187_08300 [Candidatus Amulumruptor caecigallinarius]|nr:hypothetical protein [Candidatus Amulumruptor caecigallinarius]MCM1397470.1 hypothetical protein [Candidatus Amulumruptor caecigallinarius]MCM1454323.1 hypothetical protein [bacterium]